METKFEINIIRTIDYRTPEQRRMAWKPRDYNPEIDLYKDMPPPKLPLMMPCVIGVNTPIKPMVRRQLLHGEKE